MCFYNPVCLPSESWEYREGRMLSYELILKYLITNHSMYTFNVIPDTERGQSFHQNRRQRQALNKISTAEKDSNSDILRWYRLANKPSNLNAFFEKFLSM